MKLVECDHAYSYLFLTERLWEHRDLDWVKRLVSAGLSVKDVRKVVHEGRGVLRVEFWNPTAIEDVLLVMEATAYTPPSGQQEYSEEPLHGHFYRVKNDILVRTSPASYAMEPVTLIPKTEFRQLDELTGGQWIMLIMNGPYKDMHILVSQKEWHVIGANVTDLGTELTRGAGNSEEPNEDGLQDTTPDGAGDATARHPGPKGPHPGLTPKAPPPKKVGFPPFPTRQPLSNYLSKKNSKKKKV